MTSTKRYHIWTIGCQMNEADSGRVAAELDALGYAPTDEAQEADVIILNTCVVRQSAEDRALGRLWSLKPLKDRDPGRTIALMGCMVGIKPNPALAERFPFVDVFMPPSDPRPLVGYLAGVDVDRDARQIDAAQTLRRHWYQDETGSPEAAAIGIIPGSPDPHGRVPDENVSGSAGEPPDRPMVGTQGETWETGPVPMLQSVRHISSGGQAPVAAHVPVVYGCSHACTFCIIPFRRGPERSRPLLEIVREVRDLVDQGVREVTLLGQIVDRYGKDLPGGKPDLATLLYAVHEVEGLWRIRFLTSHPDYMGEDILHAVRVLPKVCEQIEVPVQAGDDDVLARMRRGYTRDDYRRLVAHIREVIPGAAVHTDVIVGFPGETEAQFQHTYDLLSELKLDKAHLAMYSPRPGTVSSRKMKDDVLPEEKKRRWAALDTLQAQVVGEINHGLLGKDVEVLVEGRHKGKWRGRTRTDKIVFFESQEEWGGRLAPVRVTWAGPWSMLGEVLE